MLDLALLEPSPGGNSEQKLREIGAGAAMLALINSANTSAVAAITDAARRGASVAAIVFEGFEDNDGAAAQLQAFQRSGVAALICRKDELQKAAIELESGNEAIVHRKRERTAAASAEAKPVFSGL